MRLVADTLAATGSPRQRRSTTGTGLRILRADAQFYTAGVIAACHRAGARFSITTGMNPSIKRAVLGIPEAAWQQISYPTGIPDPDTGEFISDAEVAEIPACTAFASRERSERVTARLIVRRVRDLAKPPPSASRANCSSTAGQ